MAKISNLTELTTATDTSEIVINDGTPTTKKITVANLKTSLGLPIYTYKGFISQSGTNVPTLVELYNNFGVTPTALYDFTGTFRLQLTGLLTANKSVVKIYQGNQDKQVIVNSYVVDVNDVSIKTIDNGLSTNGILSSHLIEIEVYA